MPRFIASFPASAVGASKVHFDFWNGSDDDLVIERLLAFPERAVAVTGTLAIALFLTRTSAVGTGGTGLTSNGTDVTAATISKQDSGSSVLPSGISGRVAPTGGATAGAVIAQRQVHPEEMLGPLQLADFVSSKGLIVPALSGVRMVQGSVESVGSVIFGMDFAAGA